MLTKIHLENGCARNLTGDSVPVVACRTSAAILTKWNMRVDLSTALTTAGSLLSNPKTKHACSPCAVNNFNKTYSTSAAPLLVQNVWYVCGAVARNPRNISKIKLKTH